MNYREIENRLLGWNSKEDPTEIKDLVSLIQARKSIADQRCHHILSTMGDQLDKNDATNPFQIWFDHVSEEFRNWDRLSKVAAAYGWV